MKPIAIVTIAVLLSLALARTAPATDVQLAQVNDGGMIGKTPGPAVPGGIPPVPGGMDNPPIDPAGSAPGRPVPPMPGNAGGMQGGNPGGPGPVNPGGAPQ